jgi:hypothetical protein
MSAENSQQTSLKQKAVHEAKEITVVFLYLAIFFCTLATYSMLLLEKFEIWYFTYGPALLNVLVITKIILIGEAVHLQKARSQAIDLFLDLQGLCLWAARVRFSYGRGSGQAADPWEGYRWGVPRRAHRRPAGPQCDHFPGVHSFLCIQGAGARYRSGETSGPFLPNRGTVERSYCV